MIEIKNVTKYYKEPGLFSSKKKKVLDNVELDLDDTENTVIIGESGSGKSTLGRLILGIEKPNSGEILLDGKNICKPSVRQGRISAVFQDYTSSINPNMSVYTAIKEPMNMMHRSFSEEEAAELLVKVGLDGSYLKRFPHELSGGQVQRVAIARALSTNPHYVLLDEAVSSLDVSIQVQILDLFLKLSEECNVNYLLITHDIQIACYLCSRLVIFNQGHVVEQIDRENVSSLKNEYSRRLLESIITI